MKCCESCIYGDYTNDICCACIGSKYTAKSVEEQSKNTTNNLEEFSKYETTKINYTYSCDK